MALCALALFGKNYITSCFRYLVHSMLQTGTTRRCRLWPSSNCTLWTHFWFV